MEAALLRPLAAALALIVAGTAAGAAEERKVPDPSRAYMRQLARPGAHVLVVEYFDPRLNAAVDRLGLVGATPFAALAPAAIRASDALTLRLSGIVPCGSGEPVAYEEFQGSCVDLTRYGLEQITRNARVLLCRAYLDQRGRPSQEATCFAYTVFPGALESVDMVEDSLVGQGMAFVARGVDGRPVRPDLAPAEQLARGQALALWSLKPVPKPAGAP